MYSTETGAAYDSARGRAGLTASRPAAGIGRRIVAWKEVSHGRLLWKGAWLRPDTGGDRRMRHAHRRPACLSGDGRRVGDDRRPGVQEVAERAEPVPLATRPALFLCPAYR